MLYNYQIIVGADVFNPIVLEWYDVTLFRWITKGEEYRFQDIFHPSRHIHHGVEPVNLNTVLNPIKDEDIPF